MKLEISCGARLSSQFIEETHLFIELLIDAEWSAKLVAQLRLLREELVDKIVWGSGQGTRIRVSFDGSTKLSRGEVHNSAIDASICLSKTDLEFAESYSLKYFRDSMAEVNHIDIPLYGSDRGLEVGTLVIKADQSSTPLSPGEAGRILGFS